MPDTLAFDRPADDDVDDKLPTNKSNADRGDATHPPTPVNPANVSVCTTTGPTRLDGSDDHDAEGDISTGSGKAGDELWFHTLCAIVSVTRPLDHHDDDVPTTNAPKYTEESPPQTKR